jgi:hypothetical protein
VGRANNEQPIPLAQATRVSVFCVFSFDDFFMFFMFCRFLHEQKSWNVQQELFL